jgi:O-antigen ligase/tetratricopeptide (TPR) repeat protein
MVPKLSKSAYLFIIFLIIIPLTKSQLVIDPALLPKQLLFSLFTLVLSFFVLFDNAGKKNIVSTSGYFIFILIGIFILISSVSIFNAINQGEAIAEWLRTSNNLILIPLGYFALKKTNQTDLIKFLSIAVSVVTLIVVLSGLFRFAGLLISEEYGHQLTYKINVTFGHRNLYSQFLLLCMPFILMGIILFKTRLRLFLIILSFFIVLLITVLLTKSVWISLIAAIVQTFILGVFLIRDKKIKKHIIPASIFFVAIIISTIILIKLTSVETFTKQTYFIENYKHGSSLERVNLWEKSLQIFKESPVFGIGQAGWKIYIPKYGTKEMHSSEGNIHFQRPHNDFLWILTENGIIALFLYLIIIGAFYFYAFSNLFKVKTFKDKALSITLLFGLTSFLIISFFSFPKERVEHTFYFYTILILILLTQREENKVKKNISPLAIKRIVVITAIILSAATLVVTTIRIKSEIHTLNALELKSKSSWKGVIKEVNKAESYFYKTDPTATPLCWYSGSAYFNLGDKKNAYDQFKKAYTIHPNHVHVLNNLATSYELNGLHDSAIVLYKRAIKISPGFVDPYLNLCAVYFNTGQIDLAYEILMKIDPENSSQKYEDYLITVIKEKIRLLKNTVNERVLSLRLEAITISDDWMLVIHQHSIENNSDIETQLIEEAIYSLEEIDKAITHIEAENFRKKYIKKE